MVALRCKICEAQLASAATLESQMEIFYAMKRDEERFKIHDALPSSSNDAITAEAVEPLGSE